MFAPKKCIKTISTIVMAYGLWLSSTTIYVVLNYTYNNQYLKYLIIINIIIIIICK